MTVTLKKIYICVAGLFLLVSGCSIKRMAFNGIANTLAPFPAPKSGASGGIDAAAALTGEDDVKLVSEVFPTVLKTYEILHLSNPQHRGLAVMSGSLYIMYANAFVQTPADYIPETQFQKKNLEYLRAKKFYLRGADYVMQSLDGAYKGFVPIFLPAAEPLMLNHYIGPAAVYLGHSRLIRWIPMRLLQFRAP